MVCNFMVLPTDFVTHCTLCVHQLQDFNEIYVVLI